MATQPLYPPILAGTTPPFYETDEGTYIINVPFSLNKINVASEIGGVKLKIRDADTDIELGRVDAIPGSISLSIDHSEASFDVSDLNGINVGKYYKIQLAYTDIEDASNIGYYSTVSIIKCTAYPAVSILGLTSYSVAVDSTYYTGKYTNINDPSEKCYSYKFTLYDIENNILTTTGWKTHDATTDDTKYESQDHYLLEYICDEDSRYRIQYQVTTTNGLVISSPMYILCGNASIMPLIDTIVQAELNYDNGCIDVYLLPNEDTVTDTTTYVGNFVLSRTSSKDEYRTQVQVSSFVLTGTLPKGPVFHDCTLEHGFNYKYSLQQRNSYGVYSSRLYSNEIYAVFEDAFLFDGERQLKIRFNPKVTSFKTVLQDSKKNTLGSKYPFFFRNGTVAYKEFPIGGLISYQMDENEFFLSKEEDLGMDKWWDQTTTDIIDENIAFERKFKLSVMDWLNDGNIKLFRSPGEGNYLVRLSNISLTPQDSLSRMIHSFTCTADEIAACTPANLLQYGFLKVSDETALELRFGTINFDQRIETLIGIIQGSSNTSNASQAVVDQALAQFANTNLFGGYQSQYFKLDECTPGDTWFNLDGQDYVVGATGSYELSVPENNLLTSLTIKNPTRHMPGQVTYGIWTTKSSIFDTVTEIKERDVFDCPGNGPWQDATAFEADQRTTNYMNTIQTTKEKIKNILFMNFELKDLVYEIASLESWQEAYDFYLNELSWKPTMIPSIILWDNFGYNNNARECSVYTVNSREMSDQLLTDLKAIRSAIIKAGKEITDDLNNDDHTLYPTNTPENWADGTSQLHLVGAWVPELQNKEALLNLWQHYLSAGSTMSLARLPSVTIDEREDSETKIEIDFTRGSGYTPLEQAHLMSVNLDKIITQLSQTRFYSDVPMGVKVYRVEFNSDDIISGTEQVIGKRDYKDLFIDNALFYCPSTGAYYTYDASTQTLIEQYNINPTVKITLSDGTEQQVQLTNSQVCIDNEIIDVALKGYYKVPYTSAVPYQLSWGVSVTATLAYQLLTLMYGVETKEEPALGQDESLVNLWNRYSKAAQEYHATALQFVKISPDMRNATTTIQQNNARARVRNLVRDLSTTQQEKTSYFRWDTQQLCFVRYTREECAIFNGSEVWVPYDYNEFTQDPTWHAGSKYADNVMYTKVYGTQINYWGRRRDYYKSLDATLALEELEVVVG